jgi:glycosyltransferase involved in cell wall biosynthesis
LGSRQFDSLLVIIPAYNEQDALPRVLETLRAELPGSDIVVVDDGSKDDTAVVAALGGAQVLPLPYNLGIGGALRTGFRYAVRHGYTRAIQFDADGQHEASAVAPLLEKIDEGADLAIGSRFAGSGEYEVGWFRRRAMSLLRWMVYRWTGTRFSDTSSGFRAFSGDMLKFFAINYPAEYMESVEALLIAHRNGFEVVEVPVRMNEREAGQPSNRNVRLLYHFCRLVLVVAVSRRSRRPSNLADETPEPAGAVHP